MNEGIIVRKFRVTRWHQLFSPQEITIDNMRVLARKRKFPLFWLVKEESIPLRSVASVQINRGLLFSSIMIENSGGPYPIALKGIPNRHATEIRHIVEDYSRYVSTLKTIGKVVEQISEPEKPVKRSMSKSITSKGVGRKKAQPLIIEPAENAWDASTFDPLVPIEKYATDKENPKTPNRQFVKDKSLPIEPDPTKPKTWDQIPSRYIISEQEEDMRESLDRSKRKLTTPKPIKDLDPNRLPSIEEAIYGSCEKEKSGWMNDLVSPPSVMSKKKGE